MRQPEHYTCDACGREKGETNHWWLLRASGYGLGVFAWSDDLARADGVRHICGEQCLHAQISSLLPTFQGAQPAPERKS